MIELREVRDPRAERLRESDRADVAESVGILSDAIADLSEMASTQEVDITDVLDAIADLSENVSELYEMIGG